jgi:DNA gyrase subunit A
MGRTASGVRGISIKDESDEVIGMVAVDKDAINDHVLVVTENGYGKRTKLVTFDEDEDVYRITKSRGKGVKIVKYYRPKTGSYIISTD